MKSKTFALVFACLLVVSLFAVPVVAVDSTPEDLPDETEVGSETEATFELSNLYEEFEAWTLQGETNLTNVTWTVSQYNQAGEQVGQQSYDGQEFTEAVDIDDGTHTIEVRVVGTVPEIEELSYDPPQAYRFAEFSLVRDGGTEGVIETHEVHHYTEESKEAWEAVKAAEETVEAVDDDDAARTLENAISAYEAGDFDNAIDLADQAESAAERSQTIQSAMLYGGIGLVALVAAVGGVYVYRKRKQDPSRLR